MEPADDNKVNTTATPGVRSRPHRPRGAVLLMAIAASLAALLPNAAQAHDYRSGLVDAGDAEINLTPDGYPHPPGDPGEPFHFGGRDYTVDGRNFIADDLVYIFQCPVTRSPFILLECERLTVLDSPTATFNVDVHMDDRFTSATHPNGVCYGPDSPILGTSPEELDHPLVPRSVQCSVVAVNFGLTGTITRMAEHYVCFTGMFIGTGPTDTKCVDEP